MAARTEVESLSDAEHEGKTFQCGSNFQDRGEILEEELMKGFDSWTYADYEAAVVTEDLLNLLLKTAETC